MIHVDTINLDGESNLKEKFALFEQVEVNENQIESLTNDDEKVSKIFSCINNLQSTEPTSLKFNGAITCSLPNENLEHWDGVLNFKSEQHLNPKPANIQNFVLRGSILRNTESTIGIIVYSGMQTKIMRNFKKIPYKVSYVMDLMNKMLYTVFAF